LIPPRNRSETAALSAGSYARLEAAASRFMRGIEVKAILLYEHGEIEPPLELAELQTFN
jgi:hypothetical protein